MRMSLRSYTALAAVMAVASYANPAWAEGPADTKDALNGIDIIVTATRRDEKLNSIPVAIQAFSGKTLEQLNVTSFDKLVEYLPNVRTSERAPGVGGIYIRGMSTDTPGLQISGTGAAFPNVALYLNDAPSSMPGRNLDIYPVDLQRVEVLAGPQGTLFGASAMAGAIRYITNKPDLAEFHAGISLNYSMTHHGDPSGSGSGFINFPIIKDKLALRVALFDDHKGGYINNIAGTYQMPFNGNVGVNGALPTGNPALVAQALASCVGVTNCTGSGYTSPVRDSLSNAPFVKNHFNDADYVGGRAELTWQIDPDWSLELMHMRQTLTADGTFDFDPTLPDLSVQIYNNNTLKDKFDDTAWTLNGRLGALSVLYTGSYLNHLAVEQIDYSHYATIGKFMPYYSCNTYTSYLKTKYSHCYAPNAKFNGMTRNQHWVHEFRVNTPGDRRYRITAGAYYDVNRVYDDAEWSYAVPGAGFPQLQPIAGNNYVTGPYPLGVAFANDVIRRDRQLAGFGEASFDLIPKKLIATGGIRYYSEDASMTGTVNSVYGFRPTGYQPCTQTVCAAGTNLDSRLAGDSPTNYSGALIKANLTYKFDQGLVYATFSQGYRPGGFNRKPCSAGAGATADYIAYCNASRAYAPDKDNNYEIGWKLGLFDHRLQFNAAAYWIDWKNAQMLSFNQNISNQAFTLNFANARIKGIEGDVTFRASHELTFMGGFSYNDSKVLSYLVKDAINLASMMPIGSPLAQSPKFQGNIRLRYEPQIDSDYKPFFGVGMHYVGSTISSDIANNNITCGFVCGTGGTYNGVAFNQSTVVSYQQNAFQQNGYATAEASAGFTRENWVFEIYADNITDARPHLFTSGNDGEVRVTTSRPRTIGMKLSYKM